MSTIHGGVDRVSKPRIGILGAMDEEVRRLRDSVGSNRIETSGRRPYVLGEIAGHPMALAFSRWGKVAAASTATTMIERFGVEKIVFIGVAGAVDPTLSIGDVVVASSLVHHDLDARPFIKRFEVPLLELVEIPTDPKLSSVAESAAAEVLGSDLERLVSEAERRRFGIETPAARRGMVASGDRFIADPAEIERLRLDLPRVLAVEMEGAAVAQVCFEHGVPCAVIRTISDRADHAAPVDFGAFVSDVASRFGEQLVRRMFEKL